MPARLAPTGTGTAANTLAAGNDPRFVNGAMQTLTVSTSFAFGAADNQGKYLVLNSSATSDCTLEWQHSGLAAFRLGLGPNAAGDLNLWLYDTSANFVGSTLYVERATGILNVLYGLKAPTPAVGDNSTSAATTAFVSTSVDGLATLSTTGGTTTLTAAQYGPAGLIVTGALTSNAVLVSPNTSFLRILNRTTGAFTLTVKTASGTGVAITQGTNNFLIADGTNVVVADTDINGIPIGAVAPASGTFTTLNSTGYRYASGAAGLTAAGTTQATALALTKSNNVLTTVASGAGAILPNVPPLAGSFAEFNVFNAGANALLLYPASGLAINALAANAALSVAAGAAVRGVQSTTGIYRFA